MLEEPGKKTTAEVDIRNACFRRRKTCEMHEITLVSWAKEKKNCMKWMEEPTNRVWRGDKWNKSQNQLVHASWVGLGTVVG
jgi:hypothetical protein